MILLAVVMGYSITACDIAKREKESEHVSSTDIESIKEDDERVEQPPQVASDNEESSNEDYIEKIFKYEESEPVQAETYMSCMPYNSATSFSYDLKVGWGENGWVYAIDNIQGKWSIGEKIEGNETYENSNVEERSLVGETLIIDKNEFKVGKKEEEDVIYTACSYKDYENDMVGASKGRFNYFQDVLNTTHGIVIDIIKNGERYGAIYYIDSNAWLAIRGELYALKQEEHKRWQGQPLTEEDLFISDSGVNIGLNTSLDLLESIIGQPNDTMLCGEEYKENVSIKTVECIYEGIQVLIYNWMAPSELETSFTQYISNVIITTPRFKTYRGVKIGDSVELVKTVYGDENSGLKIIDKQELETEYAYESDRVDISFMIDSNDQVSEIHIYNKNSKEKM